MEPETLYLENRRLLYHLARQYLPVLETRGDVDLDDLTQAGFFGLSEAEKTWRPQGGKSWAGWAAWYARREMEKALGVRRTAGNKRAFPAPPLSLDEPLNNGAETARGDLILDTRLSDHTDVLFAQGLQAAVRAAVDTLPIKCSWTFPIRCLHLILNALSSQNLPHLRLPFHIHGNE